MRTKLVKWAAPIAMLAVAGAVSAHHSISMFDISTPIWVEGVVVSHDAVNPHTILSLEESASDGTARRWLVEGPSLQKLARMGLGSDFIRPGDVLQVCGFPPKAEFSSQRASPDSAGYPAQAFHGHLLVMPGGRMSIWGSYGKLENCIRPGDQPQMWIDFINTDPMARDAWCASRAFASAASPPPRGLINEINRRMTNPCD